MLKKLINRLSRETWLYLIFGGLTTLLNMAVYWVAYRLTGGLTLLANAIAFVLAVLFAYVTNKHWVFASHDWRWPVLKREFTVFLVARLLSFGFEELGLLVFVDLMGLKHKALLGISGALLVKIVLSVFVVIFNYFASKWFIFTGGGTQQAEPGEDGTV